MYEDTGTVGLRGGELNAAVSDAIVAIHRDYVGRGAKRTRTFHKEDTIVTVMEETMTKAEQSLVAKGSGESVHSMRLEIQKTMSDDYVSAIERLTGKHVKAFMSANHLDPDFASEVFILSESLNGES